MKGTTKIMVTNQSPVSYLTAETVMVLQLERFMPLAKAASYKPATRTLASRRTKRLRAGLAVRVLVGLLVLIALAAAPVRAQSTFGSIRGTVADVSGAAIPGAQVTLHSIDENTDHTVTSDDTGNYILENVKAGKYSLHAKRTGFADALIDNIALAARQDLRFTLQMPVAAQSTTVEVTASNTGINTENVTVGDSKNAAQIGELPLNSRGHDEPHRRASRFGQRATR